MWLKKNKGSCVVLSVHDIWLAGLESDYAGFTLDVRALQDKVDRVTQESDALLTGAAALLDKHALGQHAAS